MDWPQETYSVRWPLGLTIRLLAAEGISALRVCRSVGGVWDNTWGWVCKWYGPPLCRVQNITLHLRKLPLLVWINTQNWANPLPQQIVKLLPPPTHTQHTKCLRRQGQSCRNILQHFSTSIFWTLDWRFTVSITKSLHYSSEISAKI